MSCRRTARIVAATLDERPLSDADQRHVATCRHCTAALERLPDFEGAVGRAVQSLVAEAEQSVVPEVSTPPVAPTGRPPAFPRLIPSLVAVVALVAVAAGGLFLVTRPGTDPGATAAVLPVVESEAVAALEGLEIVCREGVIDPVASPAVEGQSCQRVAGGLVQGAALEQLAVDLRRGGTGITRASVTIRPMQFEGSQGPGTSPTSTPLPLEPQPALGRVAAVLQALFDPEHEAEVRSVLTTMIDATGRACGCERPTSVGRVRIDGDQFEGYTVSIGAAGDPLPPVTPRP